MAHVAHLWGGADYCTVIKRGLLLGGVTKPSHRLSLDNRRAAVKITESHRNNEERRLPGNQTEYDAQLHLQLN